VAVVVEQRIAVKREEPGPSVIGGHQARLAVRRPGSLVGHLEEQQVGELLDVVAIRHAIITKHIAVIPKLLNQCG
jgi:hypothetical protein